MSTLPVSKPVPNPAFDRLKAARVPRNDQIRLFQPCDPDSRLVIARRLGTRYANAA